MDVIAEIRRRHHINKESISSLASPFNLSRPNIRKHLKTIEATITPVNIEHNNKVLLPSECQHGYRAFA
jgi:hypothetical protein